MPEHQGTHHAASPEEALNVIHRGFNYKPATYNPKILIILTISSVRKLSLDLKPVISEMSVTVNKKQKHSLKSELDELSKEALIDKVIQLEAHNLQLRNIIQKQNNEETDGRPRTKRKFDFSKVEKRHVLLKFLYFGWDYKGYACQEDTNATIEHHLFAALKKTCLIESRENSNYHRCGRTDKGVSAFCQVVSIDLRSKYAEDDQLNLENIANEINYCGILNRVLPSNIKCISWMPLRNKAYSARFDCMQRTYRYFFPAGDLDIEEMRKGCEHLIGTHDFRNLCKMDVANGVTNFVRSISSAEIRQCPFVKDENSGYEMFYLEITGQSFLWHQIRCIMSILFLIGQRLEASSIISELLDVITNPCKPQYNLANGIPLNLYSCEFRDKTFEGTNKCEDVAVTTPDIPDTTDWIYNKESVATLIECLQSEWSLSNIRSTMMRVVLNDIEKIFKHNFGTETLKFQANTLQEGTKPKHYQKLLSRKRCESLENRIAHYVKKRRIVVNENE